jgi:hypothetical protein
MVLNKGLREVLKSELRSVQMCVLSIWRLVLCDPFPKCIFSPVNHRVSELLFT